MVALAALKSALDLLYPRNCQVCATPQAETDAGVLCAKCAADVPWITAPCCEQCSLPFAGEVVGTFRCGYCAELDFRFSRAVAACRAKGVARTALIEFKYNRQMYFGPHLAEWLLTAARQRLDWAMLDVIVPVPLHPRKKRERQFNQAEYLAAAVGQAFDRPVWPRALRRVKDTPTQTRLSAERRRANLRGAFVVRQPDGVAGRRVVLVDDVFTTGTTLDACARVLRVAGAQDVVVLTVARGV